VIWRDQEAASGQSARFEAASRLQKITPKYKRRWMINSIIRGAFLCGSVFYFA